MNSDEERLECCGNIDCKLDCCSASLHESNAKELIEAHGLLLKKYRLVRKRLTIAMRLGNITISDIQKNELK